MTGQPAGSTSGGLAEAATARDQNPTAWYLGRDGQQFGPVSDAEFRRLFESGQLLSTDLVWREGFAEWQPLAAVRLSDTQQVSHVVPPPPSVGSDFRTQRAEQIAATSEVRDTARGIQQPSSDLATTARSGVRSPNRHDVRARAGVEKPSPPARRRTRSLLRIIASFAIFAFFAVTLGAAYLAFIGDRNLMMMAKAVIPSFGSGITTTAPIGGFATTAEATDLALQQSLLWQVLRKHHPEWYSERLREVAEAKRANKSDKEIATTLMQSVVALRRKFAGDATSAPYVRLKTIAMLFTSNLAQMRKESIDTCYQFVSAGEGAPAVVALLQSPEHTSALQAQLVEIFEAISEGRRSPRIYPAPKPQDYDALVKLLEERGWKNTDMQLFSDSAALAKASPETVCRLVTEWFESQLKIQDQDQQLRLIVDSLKPVVAG